VVIFHEKFSPSANNVSDWDRALQTQFHIRVHCTTSFDFTLNIKKIIKYCHQMSH